MPFNFKTALDLSQVKGADPKSGAFGTFNSNFNEEEKRLIRDQMGVDTTNLGIKKFKRDDPRATTTIQENLAFFFMHEYINKNTGLVAPTPPIKLSFPLLFSQNILVTEKINGTTLKNFSNSLLKNKIVDRNEYYRFINAVKRYVYLELLKHNINCDDLNEENIMILNKFNQYIVEEIKNGQPLHQIDYEKKIALIDFGWISTSNPEIVKRLKLLKERLLQFSNKSRYINYINDAINNMIED